MSSDRPLEHSEAVASELRDVEQLLNTAAQASEAQRTRPESVVGRAADTVNSAGNSVSNSSGLDLLWDSVNSLVDGLPGLVKALDDISRIHPYIAAAVGVFKVVIELEVKRRDNDKKVNLLFLEMKNMMSALLQLQNVRPNHIGRDGLTVGMRLKSIVKQTAADIKECANACDTYMKKRLLVKVPKSGAWDETLKGYVQIFADRKTAFVFAMSIHTGMAVDNANDKLDQLMTRMDVLLEFFEKAAPQNQRILKIMVQRAGGTEQALKEQTVVQELLKREQSLDSARTGDAPVIPGPPLGYASRSQLQLLKTELAEAPVAAIRSNFESFERKFEILQQEMIDEMRKIVVHEGDRVISTVLSGPHDRIIDPDMFELWKDMRWRGIVKARHLVLAIHDYYLQKLDDLQHGIQSPGHHLSESDIWAVEQLDLMHLQPVIEALDADASGFVTIQELNQFTNTRPQGWSLPHWLAFWAIGWQLAMTDYRKKIVNILKAMSNLAEGIRHANRSKVRWYLEAVKPLVDEMTSSFQGNTERLSLLPRFQAHIQREETRVSKHLETARYDLDAPDTLAFINGRRGLERNIFTLLYLLLVRHYNIMKMGQKCIIHPDKLLDAESSIQMVKDVYELRRQSLSCKWPLVP
ncbi:hypothetical protein OH76DRAFT_1351074 [Lentinus brumalis]|uniref:EF-hand domain-containing protein n=1 Tax=Lentinus brumalis TaxID=2498619 RepID=A0A371D9J7_9APHY|nr:hypothetical protein OH76DRAFT_1351074 [Polyporus brumalis]